MPHTLVTHLVFYVLQGDPLLLVCHLVPNVRQIHTVLEMEILHVQHVQVEQQVSLDLVVAPTVICPNAPQSMEQMVVRAVLPQWDILV